MKFHIRCIYKCVSLKCAYLFFVGVMTRQEKKAAQHIAPTAKVKPKRSFVKVLTPKAKVKTDQNQKKSAVTWIRLWYT